MNALPCDHINKRLIIGPTHYIRHLLQAFSEKNIWLWAGRRFDHMT